MSRVLLLIAALTLFCGAAQADSISVTSEPSGPQPLGSTVTIDVTYLLSTTTNGSYDATVVMEFASGSPDASLGESTDTCTITVSPLSSSSCTLAFTFTNDGAAGIDTIDFTGTNSGVGSAEAVTVASVTFAGTSAVPEPSTLLLLAPGLLALMGAMRRTRLA